MEYCIWGKNQVELGNLSGALVKSRTGEYMGIMDGYADKKF